MKMIPSSTTGSAPGSDPGSCGGSSPSAGTKDVLFDCACRTPRHLLVIRVDPDDRQYPVVITSQLSQYFPLWRRIWYAFRWVLTGRGNIEWDETILSACDVVRLRSLLDGIDTSGCKSAADGLVRSQEVGSSSLSTQTNNQP